MAVKRTFENTRVVEGGYRSIFILATSFLTFLLILGLVVDASQIAIVYIRLERAAQVAAAQAASAYPLPETMDQVESDAARTIRDSSARFNQAGVRVYTCIGDGAGDHIDASLCSNPGTKPVRVVATYHIDFTFLQMLGISGTEITVKADGVAANGNKPESAVHPVNL